jgi:hypothetical protein
LRSAEAGWSLAAEELTQNSVVGVAATLLGDRQAEWTQGLQKKRGTLQGEESLLAEEESLLEEEESLLEGKWEESLPGEESLLEGKWEESLLAEESLLEGKWEESLQVEGRFPREDKLVVSKFPEPETTRAVVGCIPGCSRNQFDEIQSHSRLGHLRCGFLSRLRLLEHHRIVRCGRSIRLSCMARSACK